MTEFHAWENVAFRCVSGVAFVLFLYSVHMLSIRRTVPLAVLAFVNISLSFVNILYSMQRYLSESSTAAYAADALQACIAPGFVVVAFEFVYHLHMRRRAKFLCISFDQGQLHATRAHIALWTVRVIAAGLVVIGILVNFELVGDDDEHDDDDTEGHAGFVSVDDHSQILHALSIVPIVFMLFIAVVVTIETLQYGSNTALSVTGAGTWAAIALGTAILIAGEFFTAKWYMVTSNLGRVIFAISLIVVAHTASRDIAEMNTFEDYLAKNRSSRPASSARPATDDIEEGEAEAGDEDDDDDDDEDDEDEDEQKQGEQPRAGSGHGGNNDERVIKTRDGFQL